MARSDADTDKKRVLALPIDEEGIPKVLLLEPGETKLEDVPLEPRPVASAGDGTAEASASDGTGEPETVEQAPGEAEPGAPEETDVTDEPAPDEELTAEPGAPEETDVTDEPAPDEPAEAPDEPDDGPEDADASEDEDTEDDKSGFSIPFLGGGDEDDEVAEEAGTDGEPVEPEEPATADASNAEDEDTEDGKSGFSIPFLGGKDEDEDEAPEDPEAEEPATADASDAEDEDTEDKKTGFSIPFLGGKDDEEEDEEDAEAEADDEEPVEPDAEDEPADEVPAPDEDADEDVEEPPTVPVELEAADVDLEEVGSPLEGTGELDVGDEEDPHRLVLDPIPIREPQRAPSETDEAAEETAEPGEAPVEPAEPVAEPDAGTPRLDRQHVQQIHYAVDRAIYETADRGGVPGFREASDAVDRIVDTAESEPADDPAQDTPTSLPSTDRGLDEIPDLDATQAERLTAQGVESVTDLAQRDPVTLAIETGLKIRDIRIWQQAAELLHVPAIEPDHAELLTKVGIHRIEVLANQDVDDLTRRVEQYMTYRGSGDAEPPATSLVERWVQGAEQIQAEA